MMVRQGRPVARGSAVDLWSDSLSRWPCFCLSFPGCWFLRLHPDG